MSVQRRLDVLDEEHFVDQAVKLAGTFLNFKKIVDVFLGHLYKV